MNDLIRIYFYFYKVNPEEFISKVSRLIMEQKATIIVDHISYNQVDGEYSSDIFTQEKHTTMDKAYEGKKSIVDYDPACCLQKWLFSARKVAPSCREEPLYKQSRATFALCTLRT